VSDDRDRYRSIDQNIAANVRAYREASGVTQDELAQRMTERGFGFSQATVWKIESGQRPVRASELMALAASLDIRSPTRLTYEPDVTRHEIQLEDAKSAAYTAYHALKEAAAAYLEAQIDLVFVAHQARDAGLVVTELDTSWLTTPPEQAVFESRIEARHEEELGDHLIDELDKINNALRASGYEPNLRVEDIKSVQGGAVLVWAPDDADLSVVISMRAARRSPNGPPAGPPAHLHGRVSGGSTAPHSPKARADQRGRTVPLRCVVPASFSTRRLGWC
jgi:transcriptional regulator with XRE-family HTH domain